jgi:hypothetical protein
MGISRKNIMKEDAAMTKRTPNSTISKASPPLYPRRKQYGASTPSGAAAVTRSKPKAKSQNIPQAPDAPILPPVPIAKHEPIPPPAPPTITVEAILAGKLSEQTKRAYRSDLKHFLKFLGSIDVINNPDELITILYSVDRNTAAAYRDHMLQVENMAAATINRHLATVNTIYIALLEEGMIARNPFSWVKRPKVPNTGKTAAFTQEQAESIIAQPDISTPMGKRDRILLLLLFFCGLRRSEVVKVSREDFFETQGHLML